MRAGVGRVAGHVRAVPVVATAAVTLTLALGVVSAAHAQERILSYDSEIQILADGTLEVTEHIAVAAEGRQIRRGIYRDFPTRYRDRYGNRVVVGLEVLGVERNGQPEPWFTERVANGIRINTGGDDFLRVPAYHNYTLRYRTTRQLGFFRDGDELYWNAIGTGWVFPIESGRVEVRLPEAVPVERMTVEGYTGPQGVQGRAYVAELPEPGLARFTLTAPLAPREGFTIVLIFPKGLIPEPTTADRVAWFLADNRGALVALAGLAVLLLFCFVRWWQVGRDPRPGVVIPRYSPPPGRSPAALRYVRRMGYDNRCFSSDVLDLAVAGHLRIVRSQRPGADRLPRILRDRADDWVLERDGAMPLRRPEPCQELLLDRLFSGGRRRLELKDSNHGILQAANRAHTKQLERDLHGRYFERNSRSVVATLPIIAATMGLAILLSGGHGIPVLVGVFVIMVIVVGAFGRAIRAPTPAGRALLDEIEGLRLYLSVAERQELAGMKAPVGAGATGRSAGAGVAAASPPPSPDHETGLAPPPDLDADRYGALLPYAVALDVEDAWTKKFTAAVGAAAAAEATSRMTWYAGSRQIGDLGSFSRSLGSGLSSTIASASSPPGSSSGGGGGGSSGGGGGGGGGGGR